MMSLVLKVVHIEGKVNTTADTLSRWSDTDIQKKCLHLYVAKPKWVKIFQKFEFCLYIYFSDLSATLAKQAHARLPAALAGSTNRAYQAMFRVYLAFLTFNAISTYQVTVDVALAFLE